MLSRLDTYNARVLYRRLRSIDGEIQKRRRLALYYRNLLPRSCTPQIESPEKMSSYEHLVVELENRDEVQANLQALGIKTKIHYRLPYKMKGFQHHKSLKGMNTLEVTEMTAQRVLTLPFGYGVGRKKIRAVCARLEEIMG
jgi:aminotransferase EvaB